MLEKGNSFSQDLIKLYLTVIITISESVEEPVRARNDHVGKHLPFQT